MLLMSVGWWWWEYTLHELVRWTFDIYVFVLLYAFAVYLTSALLFPRDFDGHPSYETYFLSHRSWFFGLQIALSLIDLVDSALKGPAHARNSAQNISLRQEVTSFSPLWASPPREKAFRRLSPWFSCFTRSAGWRESSKRCNDGSSCPRAAPLHCPR